MDKEKITIAFSDVGQGDSTVVILPDTSSAIVVDCPLKPVTINYLESKRINNLHMFLTHTDLDHIGGIAELAENFEQVLTLAYNHDTCSVAKSVGIRNIYHHPKLNTFKLLRSHPQLRFICTEATDQCYSALKATHKGTFPCAGTVEVVIEKDEIRVTPDLAQHSAVIKHFDSAQCKTNS